MMLAAPRSSTTATLSKNTRRLAGTRLPSSASTPSAKAMSVAAGIAQPWASARVDPASAPGTSSTSARNTSAGAIIPAPAASTGRRRVGAWASSPTSISRFSSSPMVKKNTAISPSLIHARALARGSRRAKGRGGSVPSSSASHPLAKG